MKYTDESRLTLSGYKSPTVLNTLMDSILVSEFGLLKRLEVLLTVDESNDYDYINSRDSTLFTKASLVIVQYVIP